MRRPCRAVAGGLVLLVVLLFVVFLGGMRSGSAAVTSRVRRFNKAVGNPRMMRTAGQAGVTTSVIHHVGRSSGSEYATPVGAVRTDDGFAIALPYGRHADWMKNVLAAGSATLVHDGDTHELTDPEIVPTSDVLEFFGPNDRRAFTIFGVQECLRLRHAATA